MDYEKQASNFLKKAGITFQSIWLRFAPHFEGESEFRNVYNCVFYRDVKSFSIEFGQALCVPAPPRLQTARGKMIRAIAANLRPVPSSPGYQPPPTAYDVLSCLTKYDPGDFKNFCCGFGMDNDSIKAKKMWKAVRKEWKQVKSFFKEDEIEQLREIQ